jgi:hypothetical protein
MQVLIKRIISRASLDKRLEDRRNALRARHEREIDAAKQRSLPR